MAELLLDSVATFTATEVFEYPTLVFYAVLAALKELERPALKARVVDSPDVLAALAAAHPALPELLHALYEGRYGAFLGALCAVHPALRRDRYLAPHASYYLREMRVAAEIVRLQFGRGCHEVPAGPSAAFAVHLAVDQPPVYLDLVHPAAQSAINQHGGGIGVV